MNRSQSKIRHMRQANILLEQRRLSLINEGRRGEGNVIWVLDNDDLEAGGYFDTVEKLVNKKITEGKWKMRLINETVVIDFYVDGLEVFRDEKVGPNSDLLPEFGNKIEGNFKITYKTTVHPEAGDTYNYDYEIHIMR